MKEDMMLHFFQLSKHKLFFSCQWLLKLMPVLLALAAGSSCYIEGRQHGRASIRGVNSKDRSSKQLFNDPIDDVCYPEVYGTFPCTDSVPRKPPYYYRMLWLDETHKFNETTGFWTGNTVLLKYSTNREFLMVARFKTRQQYQIQPVFYKTHQTTEGKEKLRYDNPSSENFFIPVSDSRTFERYQPRYLVHYGNSPFQMNIRQTSKTLDEPYGVDGSPENLSDYPYCRSYRYLVNMTADGTHIFEFRSTPVVVYHTTNELDMPVTMAKVNKRHDSFHFYHVGMPVVCDGRLTYLIKPNMDEGPTKRVKLISVFSMLNRFYTWMDKSNFTYFEDLPLPEGVVPFIRFG